MTHDPAPIPPGGSPSEIEAEAAALGAMLLAPGAVDEARMILLPGDFYRPAHGHIYEAIGRLHKDGSAVDTVTVAGELERAGLLDTVGGRPALLKLQTSTPAATNVRVYAEAIVRAASGRLLLDRLDRARAATFDRGDPGEIADHLRVILPEVAAGSLVREPEGLAPLSEYVSPEHVELSPWVAPGALRQQWRIMLVAGEGVGKTTLLRQFAICMAIGVHPFTFQPVDPVRILIVDLENPHDALIEVCRPMLAKASTINSTWLRDRLWIWHRPRGIDIRARSYRAELEAAIRRTRPDAVLAGPLYKLGRKRPREDREDAALEVQDVLDDLRIRYRFGLLLEHHAPFGKTADKREMRPSDSSVWLRWPDLGLGMERVGGETTLYRLTRFRGDRLRNAWPRTLEREARPVGADEHSGDWPWRAVENMSSRIEPDPDSPVVQQVEIDYRAPYPND